MSTDDHDSRDGLSTTADNFFVQTVPTEVFPYNRLIIKILLSPFVRIIELWYTFT